MIFEKFSKLLEKSLESISKASDIIVNLFKFTIFTNKIIMEIITRLLCSAMTRLHADFKMFKFFLCSIHRDCRGGGAGSAIALPL